MANEGIQREKLGMALNMTVADGTGIEKGTILELTDPRTAAANNGSGDVFAGIALSEKIANDGRTSIAADFYGIWDLVSSGTVTAGELVSTSGANIVKTATEAEIAAGKAVGKALETGTAGERIQVKLLGY